MAEKIQVVFQGGGAKIAHYIAIAEALQEYEEEGHIELTRCAGTSAGAIVSALLSRRVDMRKVREFLCEHGSAYLEKIVEDNVPVEAGIGSKGWHVTAVQKAVNAFMESDEPFSRAHISSLLKVANGQPLANEKKLNELFFQLFQREKISSLPIIPCTIVSTNLETRRLHIDMLTEEHDDNFSAQCVTNSCSVPFFLRSFKSMKVSPLIDGGIVSNMPARELARSRGDVDRTLGDIVAFQFDRKYDANENINSLFGFSKSVLYSAIESAEQMSNDYVHVNFPIFSSIGTFEFDKTIEFISDDAIYYTAKDSFRNWLQLHIVRDNSREFLYGLRWEDADFSDPSILEKAKLTLINSRDIVDLSNLTERLRNILDPSRNIVLNERLELPEDDIETESVVRRVHDWYSVMRERGLDVGQMYPVDQVADVAKKAMDYLPLGQKDEANAVLITYENIYNNLRQIHTYVEGSMDSVKTCLQQGVYNDKCRFLLANIVVKLRESWNSLLYLDQLLLSLLRVLNTRNSNALTTE